MLNIQIEILILSQLFIDNTSMEKVVAKPSRSPKLMFCGIY